VKSSGAVFVEIGPKAGSAIPNFRAVICDNPTTGYGSFAASAAGIWVGIAPDGGTLGSYKSATPYGANRFSAYWLGMKTGVIENVWIVESDEILLIIGYDSSLNQTFHIEFGAIFDSCGLRAEPSGRTYGMIVGGTANMSTSFLSSTGSSYSFTATNNSYHAGCFRPDSPTIFSDTLRMDAVTTGSTSANFDADGKMFATPLSYTSRVAPYYCAGKLRQRYAYKNALSRQVVSTVSGVYGYCLSASTAAVNDALLFGNS